MANPNSIPFEDIRALAAWCRDPQQPEGIRESAAIVKAWLDGDEWIESDTVTLDGSDDVEDDINEDAEDDTDEEGEEE